MNRDFTQIPNSIILNTKMSDGAFRTYVLLKSYKYGSGKVFPSQGTLAKQRSKTNKTIIEHLKQLKRLGIITSKRRGYSASNSYEFISEENFTNDRVVMVKNSTTNVTNNSHPLSRKIHTNNSEFNNTEINNNPHNWERGKIKIKEIRMKYNFLDNAYMKGVKIK